MNYDEQYETLIERIERADLPTIHQGQGDNCIMENNHLRLWISREEFPVLSLEILTKYGWKSYLITEVEE